MCVCEREEWDWGRERGKEEQKLFVTVHQKL